MQYLVVTCTDSFSGTRRCRITRLLRWLGKRCGEERSICHLSFSISHFPFFRATSVAGSRIQTQNGKWKMTNDKCIFSLLGVLGVDQLIQLLRPIRINILQDVVLLQCGVAVAHCEETLAE